MVEKEQIVKAVFRVIDELNLTRGETKQIEKSLVTKLSGDSTVLDSLGLVNFVVSTEEKIEDEFNILLNLADERAIKAEKNPLESVDTFVQYIVDLINKN